MLPIRSLCVISLAAALGGPVAAQEAPPELVAAAELYAPAVAGVTVQPSDPSLPARVISGFFVGPGRFVTLREPLWGASGAQVTLDNGQSFPIAKILSEDKAAGLVAVSVEVPPALRRGLAVEPVDPIPGEELIIIGPARRPGETDADHDVVQAAALEAVVTEGVPMIFLDRELPQTFPGAPALTGAGRVVGMIGAAAGQPARSRIIPASRLLDLADGPGLTLAEWSAGGVLEAPRAAAPAPGAGVVRADDGSLLIDGKYAVTGEGTEANPYKVPWDLFVSVGQDYSPRQGRTKIPDRAMMFDGAWVEVTGYIAFPLVTDEPEELLAMMNQWDGCCIGIPPTPYDAIEVRLAEPVKGPLRTASYGVIKGVLTVEPNLVGNWVVGLYVMDDAVLSAKAFGSGS
jgi:hypothetical protein